MDLDLSEGTGGLAMLFTSEALVEFFVRELMHQCLFGLVLSIV